MVKHCSTVQQSRLRRRLEVLLPHLNERQRRLALATEARLHPIESEIDDPALPTELTAQSQTEITEWPSTHHSGGRDPAHRSALSHGGRQGGSRARTSQVYRTVLA